MENNTKIALCLTDSDEARRLNGLLARLGFTDVSTPIDARELTRELESTARLIVCDADFDSSEGLAAIYSDAISLPFLVTRRCIIVGDRSDSTVAEISRLIPTVCVEKGELASLFTAILDVSAELSRLEAESSSPDPNEFRISRTLGELGVPAHIKGYTYLRSAIGMVLDDSDKINFVTQLLYPGIARAHQSTSTRVERAIRHAIDLAWERGSESARAAYFGYTVNRRRGRPTNSEFIATVAEKLRYGK